MNPRIVFMGTPDFAVASLEALLKAGKQVVGVITAPDKPSGRGLKVQASPVKECAVKHGLTVLQPVNLKAATFQEALAALQPDLQIVVAFRMLPEAVWKLPKLGTFNLHASLLPQYRGAAPINWAVINGEKETGITTFFLRQEIDTGAILFQEKLPIGPDETAGELHDRLMATGADLVVKTVDAIEAATIQPVDQDALIRPDAVLHGAPKLNRVNTHIDWNLPTAQVFNLIRGLSPYPAAHTELHFKDGKAPLGFKIFRTTAVHPFEHTHPPGSIATDDKSWLRVFTPDGYLEILELQPAGKQRMKIKDLLNGFRFTNSISFR